MRGTLWAMPSRLLKPSSRLVIASHNSGKIREMTALVAPWVDDIASAAALSLPEPEETGDTFSANAALKAVAAARATERPALADDSGLVVPALGGAPGVRSARWGGPERDFAVAMRRVWEELSDLPRDAEMVCALAVAWPDGEVSTYVGRVEGTLVWPPRGELGFGYEPIFAPRGSTRTYGEMPRPEKHLDDPRARAFALLRAAHLSGRLGEASPNRAD